MSRTGQAVLFGSILVGVGVGGYLLTKHTATNSASGQITGVSVSLQPSLRTPYPSGWSVATVTWTNPTTSPITYGVQADIVVGGQVKGHLWTSQAAAQAALSAARAGGAQAARPYSLAPQYRVAKVTVPAGGTGRITLATFLDPSAPIGGAETWYIFVKPGYVSGLLVSDPYGTSQSAVAGASVPKYKLGVQSVQ